MWKYKVYEYCCKDISLQYDLSINLQNSGNSKMSVQRVNAEEHIYKLQQMNTKFVMCQ